MSQGEFLQNVESKECNHALYDSSRILGLIVFVLVLVWNGIVIWRCREGLRISQLTYVRIGVLLVLFFSTMVVFTDGFLYQRLGVYLFMFAGLQLTILLTSFLIPKDTVAHSDSESGSEGDSR